MGKYGTVQVSVCLGVLQIFPGACPTAQPDETAAPGARHQKELWQCEGLVVVHLRYRFLLTGRGTKSTAFLIGPYRVVRCSEQAARREFALTACS